MCNDHPPLLHHLPRRFSRNLDVDNENTTTILPTCITHIVVRRIVQNLGQLGLDFGNLSLRCLWWRFSLHLCLLLFWRFRCWRSLFLLSLRRIRFLFLYFCRRLQILVWSAWFAEARALSILLWELKLERERERQAITITITEYNSHVLDHDEAYECDWSLCFVVTWGMSSSDQNIYASTDHVHWFERRRLQR